MSYIYLNKYKRFQTSSTAPNPLDSYTLALATLSLASKATESPRRLRELLLPAHHLLHSSSPAQHDVDANQNSLSGPLKIPSEAYDMLRATLVQAELMLLRVLSFELKLPSPMDYLPRYLERIMEDSNDVGEDYETWGKEYRAEYGVVEGGWMGTRLGKRASEMVLFANYQLANFFPPRAVALACVYKALEATGLMLKEEMAEWTDQISSGKVDVEDLKEVILEWQHSKM
ncbi:MAG: hypothetical protein Q9195_000625 [Heterodermia aff. obscurata]